MTGRLLLIAKKDRLHACLFIWSDSALRLPLIQMDDAHHILHRQGERDPMPLGGKAGAFADRFHDSVPRLERREYEDDFLFRLYRDAEKFFRLMDAGAATIQHGAARRSCGLCRIHDLVGKAAVYDRDHEFKFFLG